jgi:uncharacterized MAPEG superfamily protein
VEPFDAYSHALLSLAGTALAGLLIAPLSAMKKADAGLTSGASPEPDYENPVYRWSRAHLNLVETAGFFAAVVVAAILTGASAFWVNLLASIFFLSRLAVLFIHVRGIGRPDMGARTGAFLVGWTMCVVLALMAIVAGFA